MLAAIRDDNPVLFFEAMSLAHAPRETIPEELETVPIGVARIARPGRDVTVVALGSMVRASLDAATHVAQDGVEVEVIDLRSIQPLDRDTVIDSVARTGRLVTAHEAWVTAGVGAEIVAAVAESCVLQAPAVRVGARPVPTPSGKVRPFALPNTEQIVTAVQNALENRAASPILYAAR